MTVKTIIVLLVGFALASVHLAEAQQAAKIPRIGYLSAASSPSPAFMQGLRDLGYVEGKNIDVVFRTTEGKSERIPISPLSWSVSTLISLWWGEIRLSVLPGKPPVQSLLS
jgi:hypothetical protein